MPDGYKRKRRNRNDARARYYAVYRSVRFAARFGGIRVDILTVYAIMQKRGER